MNHIAREPKHIYRLPPCPAYDIEGMESWLSDMAGKGYKLDKDGFFLGFAAFEKAEPRSIQYRLEPARENTDIWADNNGEPSDEAKDLNASCGWQYVALRGRFHIYCSDRADTLELNTDPRVQALAFDLVRKRERGNMITGIIWLMVFPFILLRGSLLLLTVNTGTWFVLWSALLDIWAILRSASKVIHLRKLRRKLMFGEMPDHEKNWRPRASRYRISGIAFLLLLMLWTAFLLKGWSDDMMDKGRQPLENYSGEFPFATMADLAPDGVYHPEDLPFSNIVEYRSDWLAPSVIKLRENASVNMGNNKYLSGGLYIDYYGTKAPWLAREIARELLVEGKHSKNYKAYDLQDIGADYAAAYLDYFPVVIVQQGKAVIRVTFYQTSKTYTKPLEEWAQVIADSIK